VICTENSGWVVSTPGSYSGTPVFKSWYGDVVPWQISMFFLSLFRKCQHGSVNQATATSQFFINNSVSEIISIPNIIANVRHAWLYECAFRAMREKLKLSSDGGDFGSKKYKQGYGGVWRSMRLAGVWSQEVGFVLVRLAEIWLQSPWRYFHRNFINFVLTVLFEKIMLQ
jgi:hypothetical protein